MAQDFSAGSASGKADINAVVAELKSFAAFDHWMDEQLEQLVAVWIHTAAPNAERFERMQQQRDRHTRNA